MAGQISSWMDGRMARYMDKLMDGCLFEWIK